MNSAEATREIRVSPHLVPRPGRSCGGWEYLALSGPAADRLVLVLVLVLALGETCGPAQDPRREAAAIPARK
jgi:hypothetical protein